uniref:Uncharacterized protein n=1 Tax=Anopheles braziliensis TaxID=58242 RepID=A0A2M3ZLM3_9DIPT
MVAASSVRAISLLLVHAFIPCCVRVSYALSFFGSLYNLLHPLFSNFTRNTHFPAHYNTAAMYTKCADRPGTQVKLVVRSVVFLCLRYITRGKLFKIK